MATVTPPKHQPTLVESQRRVQHPLERVRGTIRTYVGLEGAALLLTLLALWFWAGVAFDYGFFRTLSFDWVQEVSRPTRALFLGVLYLLVVFVVRMGLITTLVGEEARAILRTAFAGGGLRRQTMPVWLRLPLVGMSVGLCGWLGWAAGTWLVGGAADLLGALAAGVSGALITGAHEIFAVRGKSSISVWMRAPLAAAACLAGGYLGFAWGGELAGLAGSIIGSAVLAPLADAAALVVLSTTVLLLRGRCYVLALAIPAVLAYLAAWVAVGFLAEVVGPWISAVLVLALLAGPVVFVSVKRLLYDFRDDAIALVLERRFPKELGDRLITAVEMADPRKGARYGYSQVMIEQTIHDAAERVEQVPVREVFDWRRLYGQGLLVGALTVGLYVVAGLVFCLPDWLGETGAGGLAGFSRFHQVAGLWLERNLLLENTIWPRQAHLVVLDWPESGEKRVGRGEAAPTVRVRALKWVVADPAAREGWRALTWGDLARRHSLLGEEVPAEAVPADWGPPRDPDAGWSLDEIELRLNRSDAHATLPAETKDLFRSVLDKLEQRAADPAMRRTLRMLKVPTTAMVYYRGASGGGEMTLQKQGDNEYTGQFRELKESIRFTVRGEDYYTKTLQVTVVPTPSLVQMTREEYRPAYMYYRVAGGNDVALKGLKQRVLNGFVSTHGGDTSRIDDLPAGTDLVLTAEADKDLRQVAIAPPRKGMEALHVEAEVKLLGPRTFQVRFDNVRATAERPQYDFSFEFEDTDGVRGQRHMVIKPSEDAVPDVDVSPEVVRKTPQGYMVTPLARVPLHVKVTDDRGLVKVEYACSYERVQKGADPGGRGLLVLSALETVPGGPGQELAALARLATLSREAKTPGKGPDAGVRRFPVVPFDKLMRSDETRREYFKLEQIEARLGQQQPDFPLTRFFDNNAAEKSPKDEPDEFFNVDELKLKADEQHEVQPRYRMQLWVEATDNDVETGPHVGQSKEKLVFLIVSENELLSEIAKEEEVLYGKLADRVKALQEGMGKLDRLKEDLTSASLKPEQFSGMSIRADDLAQMLEKGEGIVQEVANDYKRILQELVTNRVQQPMIDRVEKQIVTPLEEAVARDFPRAKEGVADLHKAVDGSEDLPAKTAASRKAADEARARLDTLIRNLTAVLDKMQQLADLNVIIKMLKEVEQEEVRQEAVLKQLQEMKQAEFDKEFQGGGKKKP
jgi:hypothetical protein